MSKPSALTTFIAELEDKIAQYERHKEVLQHDINLTRDLITRMKSQQRGKVAKPRAVVREEKSAS